MRPCSLVTLTLLTLALPAQAQPDACDGITCSDHGECMLEGPVPFCFCAEGFAADDDFGCVPSSEGPDERALRSPTMGARIVRVALAQERRPMGAIGRDLAGEPGPLRRYVEPRELWCTDFVAWVYRVAGIPFTGGAEGGWHITNNHAVRRWFERNGRWVAHRGPHWETFEPRPGDYVRFHTSAYGHSGIVARVEGTTLHTIEGNPAGYVEQVSYPDFRTNRRIDGFGIVTQPAERALASAP